MDNNLLQQVANYIKKNIRQKRWQKVVTTMAAVVVFVTTYALILPAITMEQEAYCGVDSHIHDESCYTQATTVTEQQLICTIPTHVHSEACWETKQGELLCTEVVEAPHEHVEACNGEIKTLICEETECAPHTHAEACYTVPKVLTCTQEEKPAHIHSEGCWITHKVLVCELAEQAAHQHGEACYTTGDPVLTCGTEESEEHTHADACYTAGETVLSCTIKETEGHAHCEACYVDSEPELTCGTEETEGHAHEDACYADGEPEISCGLEETLGHTHSDACYEISIGIVCSREIDIVHVHGVECYEQTNMLVCALLEADPSHELHEHTEDCYVMVEVPADPEELTCMLEENEEHTHGTLCYGIWNLTCEQEEHEHIPDCFVDATAEPQVVYVTESGECVSGDIVVEISGTRKEVVVEENPSEITPGTGQVSENYNEETNPADSEKIEFNGLIVTKVATVPRFNSSGSFKDLKKYVNDNGGKLQLTLLNGDSSPLDKDESGNYIIVAGQSYELTLGVNMPNGFVPGTYTYQLPAGLDVQSGTGEFLLNEKDSSGNETGNKISIGTWSVSESGLLTFNFNEKADDYSDVIISATMETNVSENVDRIEHDGIIYVVVKPPEDEDEKTKVNKGGYGVKQDSNGNLIDVDGNIITDYATNDFVRLTSDFNRLCWRVTVTGAENSQIIGSTITDTITTPDNNYYSAADIANGITIAFNDASGDWHTCKIPADSITWTETGWSFTFPEQLECYRSYCKKTVSLSNEYKYYITYFSTVRDNAEGYVVHRNTVTVDGETGTGYLEQTSGEQKANIVKTGFFDGADGYFHWETVVTIPASSPDQYVHWQIWDGAYVTDTQNGRWEPIEEIPNGNLKYQNIEKVTLSYGGTVITVPSFADAPLTNASENKFCYILTDTMLYIGMSCACEPDYSECANKNDAGQCNTWWPFYDKEIGRKGYCSCWRLISDAILKITYKYRGEEIIEKYAGYGYDYLNNTSLSSRRYDSGGNLVQKQEGSSSDKVPIPGVFKKQLTRDPTQYNNYIATYTITINESLYDLSQWKPLEVVDQMSDTLVYIPGSLHITGQDSNGNIRQLVYGTDYTLENIADEHKLVVKILTPAQEKYIMTYDCQIVIENNQLNVPYENSATITIYGTTFEDSEDQKILAEINIVAKNYSVKIHKIIGGTTQALQGAVIGLYADNGEEISRKTTDGSGDVIFRTNVTDGLILQDHVYYYAQEIAAPGGYKLNDAKMWFYFCDAGSDCAKCASMRENAQRIPGNDVGLITLENFATYEMPATGGPGTKPFTTAGMVLMIGASGLLLYNLKKRRKEDRVSS